LWHAWLLEACVSAVLIHGRMSRLLPLLLLLLLLLLQTPTDLANAGGHGTHVSSIALGSFLHKLLDAQGQPLPYQQGVAAGAKLGAVRVSLGLCVSDGCMQRAPSHSSSTRLSRRAPHRHTGLHTHVRVSRQLYAARAVQGSAAQV
jgi:hypothetical protein